MRLQKINIMNKECIDADDNCKIRICTNFFVATVNISYVFSTHSKVYSL